MTVKYAARNRPSPSTPLCCQKRLSSTATTAICMKGEISSNGTTLRFCTKKVASKCSPRES